jgi:chemotaxis protein MotB
VATGLKQSTSDEGAGAPEWMVTFSDCMTLLLTFFVLLLSFSSFDDKVFPKMESALAEGLTSLGLRPTKHHEALAPTPVVVHSREPDAGSEKPTVDGQHESRPSENLDFLDFQSQKVFLVPSDKVFLGMGVRMSAHGRQILTDVAALLGAVPNRVVVSEHAVEASADTNVTGLKRAWEVTQFLVGRKGLDKERFSISSASTLPRDRLQESGLFAANPKTERVLEIVVLERSTYR